MVENRSSIFGIIAMIVGASGLGLGAFTVVNFQVVEGPQGPPGEDGQDSIDGIDGIDGTDGQDAPGGIVVGILDPDHGDSIWGNITIRAVVYGTENYTVSILLNDTIEIGTSLPMTWNTETVNDGWWNITIIATDIATNNQNQDEVVVYVQNVEDPTNIYYCSSQSEIEDALDTIDMGHGTIIITEDITLNSQINISDGGNYIIQGAGPVTLNRNANDETFYITNVQSLTLKDLIIDTTDITSLTIQGIYVIEGNDNPVYIQNVQIHGGNGRGIFVKSENVWIENCIIHDVSVGIYLANGSAYCHILDNTLFEMNTSSGEASGIYTDYSDFNTISGNVAYNITAGGGNAYGIILYDSNYNTISCNVAYNITAGGGNAYGIILYEVSSNSDFNTISGNGVYDISSSSGSAAGIVLLGSDSNTISGNVVYNISSSSGSAAGIVLGDFYFNTISGNVVYAISSSSGDAYGIFFMGSDYNTFTGNAISDLQASTRYGIYGYGDYNVIIGNTLYNCGTGIYITGIGNEIDHNVVV